jgi:Kef-type K+ transport system membrane component KefB
VTDLLLQLVIIYAAARLCGELAVRLGQSAVVGELLAGVLVGGSVLGWIEPTPVLHAFAEIGVLLLLFEVGLESDLQSFVRVGLPAFAVASIGVIVPFVLGYGVGIAAGMTEVQSIFVGATLTATSVAISARVLTDLGRLRSPEGQIILGAAVIDDILGLVALSVVVGLAEAGSAAWSEGFRRAGIAVLFLGFAVALGIRLAPAFGRLVARMNTRGAATVAAVAFALGLGWLAGRLHLAPIVGAFAAGLILTRTEHHTHLQTVIKPVADVFVPVFFVLIGAAVDVRLLNPLVAEHHPTLLLAGALTLVAIAGKLVAGVGTMRRGIDRWAIGIGMIPRGEVGLIFAGVGLASHIIGDGQYAAIVTMVALTTLLAPILLGMVLRR